MATPTYDLLDSTTLSSSASSVTFSGISGSYRDLVLVVNVITGGSAVYTRFEFNNDAVSEIEWVDMKGDGTAATSSTFGGVTYFGTFSASSSPITHILQLIDYSATDKHKTGLYRGSAATSQTMASAMRWPVTSAITQVDIKSFANQFQSGSTFHLYGIAA